jgi:type VI protein secretion system component Hcp
MSNKKIGIMKLIIILLSFLPLTIWAQKDEIFAKFINEDGSVIKGSSMTQYYERQIPVFSIETNSAGNSTIVSFTMPVESASGVLRNLQNSQGKMRSGEMVVTYISLDQRRVRYKINMENIAVEECTDSGSTTIVKLHASRIGWTYYSYTKSGIQSVSTKNGWDEDRGKSWTGF